MVCKLILKENITGEKKRTVKRGFKTKKEAEKFLASERLKDAKDLDMTFSEFCRNLY